MVSRILPFREENKKLLDPIWNRHHIERVEIVLKETLDVKGDSKCIITVVIRGSSYPYQNDYLPVETQQPTPKQSRWINSTTAEMKKIYFRFLCEWSHNQEEFQS